MHFMWVTESQRCKARDRLHVGVEVQYITDVALLKSMPWHWLHVFHVFASDGAVREATDETSS